MAQFPVPQFIDREMQLFGPLTVRQTLIFGAIGAILFALYFVINTYLLVPVGVVLIAFGLILAFLKINGRPLSAFLFSYLGYFINPKRYIWSKGKNKAKTIQPEKAQEKEQAPQIKKISQKEIENLADILDE